MSTFLTFQKFQHEAAAQELILFLEKSGFAYEVEDNGKDFNPAFISNPLNREISVKLRQDDFTVAREAIAAFYREHAGEIPKDYYLYTFTDEELKDILLKPDEWGLLDYELARKILKDRGREVSPDALAQWQKQRMEDLARPEQAGTYWLLIGYCCAVLFWMLGLIIGIYMISSRKTLPDGRSVYRYAEKDRRHGLGIFIAAIVCFILWISGNGISLFGTFFKNFPTL